jgi:hypothetical protein
MKSNTHAAASFFTSSLYLASAAADAFLGRWLENDFSSSHSEILLIAVIELLSYFSGFSLFRASL